MSEPITIAAFYCFTPVETPHALQAPLLALMQSLEVRGTLTLAHEGVNATISGTAAAIETVLTEIRRLIPAFAPMDRESYFSAQPFKRTKVKVKRELISLGQEANPSVCVGEYVAPEDWNALISQPNRIVIDTRNGYEFELGHFQGAINPNTETFKQMVDFTETHLKDRTDDPIAMYCTGGIRCEKYSAYLVTRGFRKVYHLRGGILAYLEKVDPKDSLWQGDCFVFDERVGVSHGLVPMIRKAA